MTMVAMLVGACGTTPASSSGSPPTASLDAGSSSSASATATAIGSPSGSPVASTLAVAVDPTLLSRVPAAIAGIPLTYDPVTTASVAADPTLGHEASGLA
ncbi:MAG: hypothetical protein QOI09_2399, partial [Chloroflexota bacterium]|nr:hypothetical protein [Chloroflexota bacterium]